MQMQPILLPLLLLTLIVIVFFTLIFYILYLKRKRHKLAQLSELKPIYDDLADSEIIAIRDVPNASLNSLNIDLNKKNPLSPLSPDPRLTTPPFEPKSTPSATTTALKKPFAVLVIYVMAKNNQEFMGYELLQTLLAAGFRFGDMSIFHRHEQPNGQGAVLFSLASATEPGSFDINRIGTVHCQGLSLFMRLTTKEHNLNALNLMLDTAYQLAEELEGVVLDGQREPLAHQVVMTFKQRIEQHLVEYDSRSH